MLRTQAFAAVLEYDEGASTVEIAPIDQPAPAHRAPLPLLLAMAAFTIDGLYLLVAA